MDRLVKLKTRDGDTRFLHVELQAQKEDAFPRRVQVYNSRASDRLDQDVVSVAVLLDDDPDWKPTAYVFECWGCKKTFEFPVVKVLDWAAREAEFKRTLEPGRAVRHGAPGRGGTRRATRRPPRPKKLTIDSPGDRKNTGRRGAAALVPVPRLASARCRPRRTSRCSEEAERQRGGEKVAFITWIEKEGIEKGLKQGIEKGLKQGIETGLKQGIETGLKQGIEKGRLLGRLEATLETKFGQAGRALAQRFDSADTAALEKVVETARAATTLEEVERLLPS